MQQHFDLTGLSATKNTLFTERPTLAAFEFSSFQQATQMVLVSLVLY